MWKGRGDEESGVLVSEKTREKFVKKKLYMKVKEMATEGHKGRIRLFFYSEL